MKIAAIRDGDAVRLGRVRDDQVEPLSWSAGGEGDKDPLGSFIASGADFTQLEQAGEPVSLSKVTWAPPIQRPSKIVAVGLNYLDHADETGMLPPTSPLLFAKTSNCLVGSGQYIRYRTDQTEQVDFEAELAVVIGRRTKDVEVHSALDHVFGYTVANDVSARDLQLNDGQWMRGKCLDTFLPLGPWITTIDEVPNVNGLAVTCSVNGTLRQNGSTADMIFDVQQLVSHISRFMTLNPGDIVLTGTPAGVGLGQDRPQYLKDGDTVTVEISSLGRLVNKVVCESGNAAS